MNFRTPPGGLNLCSLCVPGSDGCVDGSECYIGEGLDLEGFPGADDYCDGKTSSEGRVGLQITFPADGAEGDLLRLHYGVRSGYDGEGDTEWTACGVPVTVSRFTDPNDPNDPDDDEHWWTIRGERACLKEGGVQGDVYLETGGGASISGNYAGEGLPAPFLLTIYPID